MFYHGSVVEVCHALIIIMSAFQKWVVLADVLKVLHVRIKFIIKFLNLILYNTTFSSSLLPFPMISRALT